MSKDQRRLGRGLSSIISTDLTEKHGTSASGVVQPDRPHFGPTAVSRLATIPIDRIRPNPLQPRKGFDEAQLRSLAASIKEKGTLQPVVVRPSDPGYELVAGERRLRAAKIAGVTEIPAIVRDVKDEDILELALIENIQREDLNPVDRAMGYKTLMVRFSLSADQIASRTGEDRTTVVNYMRLLELEADVLKMLAGGELTMGHARSILGIKDKKSQIYVAKQVLARGWSVRQTESAVARIREGRSTETKPDELPRAAVAEMMQRLTEALGCRVIIKEGKRRHSGRVVIEYRNLEAFDRICSALGVSPESV